MDEINEKTLLINELREKIDDLEMTEMFHKTKIKELEEKRIYYRQDREKKFQSLFQNKMRHLSAGEVITERIKIKEMSIHEKFEYIDSDYLLLCDTRNYITTDIPYDYCIDHCVETDEGNIMTLMGNLMTYIKDELPNEIKEDLSEYMLDDNELMEEAKDHLIGQNEVIDCDVFEEKCDELYDMNCEKEEMEDFLKDKLKNDKYAFMSQTSLKPYWILSDNNLKDMFSYMFDTIDRVVIERDYYKSGYEAIKESSNDEEEIAIEMMEKIMDKTKAVAEADIERVKEINRLKKKCNDLNSNRKQFITQYVKPSRYRLGPRSWVAPLQSIFLNKANMEHRVWLKYKKSIYIAESVMGFFNDKMKDTINNYLIKNNFLQDEYDKMIDEYYNRVANNIGMTGDPSYIGTCKEAHENGKSEKFKKDFDENGFNRHYIKYNLETIEKDDEELLDINNY